MKLLISTLFLTIYIVSYPAWLLQYPKHILINITVRIRNLETDGHSTTRFPKGDTRVGKITFARYITFRNNILNASAEGASAILFCYILWCTCKCFWKLTLFAQCGFPYKDIRTSASVASNDTRTDESAKVHSCHPYFMLWYITRFTSISKVTGYSGNYNKSEKYTFPLSKYQLFGQVYA